MSGSTNGPPTGHPLAPLAGTIGRVPGYVRLANALIRDPRLSKPRKAALAAGLAYLVSPIDLVPGFVPVAGQLDDLAVVLFAIRTALRGLPADEGRRHVLAAGLPHTALATDIGNVQAAARWTVETVARTTRGALSWSLGATQSVVGGAVRFARDRRHRRSRARAS
jgi:uncharacterized membrane protein YkvA (DUF1232 family)